MGLFNEFKKFISRGNVLDIAIGFILGAAFSKISNSLVSDVFMPPLGFLIERVKFTELKVVLREAEGDATEVAILYGKFIQVIIEFFIVGLALFLLFKLLAAFNKKEQSKPTEPAAQTVKSDESLLLEEIRDLLKQKQSETRP